MMVPKEVQDAILLKYIEICDQLYSLAFFQWRIANPSKIKNEDEELKEGVYDKYNMSWKGIVGTHYSFISDYGGTTIGPKLNIHLLK